MELFLCTTALLGNNKPLSPNQEISSHKLHINIVSDFLVKERDHYKTKKLEGVFTLQSSCFVYRTLLESL